MRSLAGFTDMKPTILILEDDFFLRQDLVDFVKGQFTAEPKSAASANQAMALISRDTQFAILDIEVLDGNSFGVAEILTDRKIPYVFVSGSDPASVPQNLRSAPFLSKPFAEEKLRIITQSLSTMKH